MLNFVCGTFSSGKTYYIDTQILNSLKSGKNTMLLVPEQEVMEAERRIADRADAEGVFCEKLTVVSFRRLANLAERSYGGLHYQYLSEGGKLLLMWKITEEFSGTQNPFRNNRDKTFVSMMLSIVEELRRYSVTPNTFEKAANKINDPELQAKYSYISLVYSAFSVLMKDQFADSNNDLSRLTEILRTEDFLSGYNVFADSFNGFTTPELEILGYIMKKTDLTVALCCPDKPDSPGFMTLEKTKKQLIGIANENKVTIEDKINLSVKNNELAPHCNLISCRLFSPKKNVNPENQSPNVVLCQCDDSFSEAEFVACSITELVRNNVRFRDIAVVSRNTSDYDGVFDVILEKYGIPVFYSKRFPLSSTELFRTVFLALDIVSGNFDTQDVLTYAKSGIVGLSPKDVDLLERYAVLWNISGKRWIDEYEWNMNPCGYTDEKREEKADDLKKINELRRKLCTPLENLKRSFSDSITATDACKSVYSFINESRIYDHYSTFGTAEDVTVFNKFTEVLETVSKIVGEIPVDAKVFSSLLSMCVSATDFGRIPQSVDQVILGDASILRLTGRKYIFLTSCEQGVFPAAVKDDSFITDREKDLLKAHDINLSPDTAERNDAELFAFLRCASAAKGKLFATCKKSEGKYYVSSGFSALQALFPQNLIITYPDPNNINFRLQTLNSSREAALSTYGTPYFDVINRIYTENGQPLLASDSLLYKPTETLSPEITKKLFAKDLDMTNYRLEAFVKCPFSYYAQYVLKLEERQSAAFGARDKGNFIHKILENVIKDLFGPEVKNSHYSEAELQSKTEEVANRLLSSYFGSSAEMTQRQKALFNRIRKSLFLFVGNMAGEFENSDFRPVLFEAKIGTQIGNILPIRTKLNNGKNIFVYGNIDRIDTFNKGDNLYVRVVDYKSGSVKHSLKNIEYGLDMQMLLYLFSIYKTQSQDVKEKSGAEHANIIPAGVLYQSTKITPLSVTRPASSDFIKAQAEKDLVRTGLLLEDVDILNAMEKDLTGKYIPVTMDKGKPVSSQVDLCKKETFDTLYDTVTNKLAGIGNDMISGNVNVFPSKNLPGDTDPCKYCEMKFICRKQQKKR